MKYNKIFLSLMAVLLLFSSISVSRSQVDLSQSASSPAISGLVEWNAQLSDDEEFTMNWNITDDNLARYEIVLQDSGLVSFKDFPENENSTEVSTINVYYDALLDEGAYTYVLTAIDFDNLESTFTSTLRVRGPPSPDGFLGPSNLEMMFIFSVVMVPIINRRKRIAK